MYAELMISSKGAVAKGAVLSKIYNKFVSSEEITRTKANLLKMELTPKMKKSKIYNRLFTTRAELDGREDFWTAVYLVKQVSDS